MTAAIGVCAGLGREATAVLSTVLALIILGVMPWVVDKIDPGDKNGASDQEQPLDKQQD
ncbi:hypothetical protein D3C78_1847340 [compost metagenome]